MKRKPIAILGFGREGESLFKFLRRNPKYKNSELWILDKNPAVQKKLPKVHWQVGKGYLDGLDKFSQIFRSPGVPYGFRKVQEAIKNGISVSSGTRLFFEQLGKKPTVIGITGTKGKGTTASLIYDILKRDGKQVVLAGNIGTPMIDALEKAKKAQYVVLELSSFQLQDLNASPHIAVIVDIFPDHLDAHQSLKEYYDAKANIGIFQKPEDHIFYFSSNFLSTEAASRSKAQRHPVNPTTDTPEKNKEMARAVTSFLGVPAEIIDKTIETFKPLPYRLALTKRVPLKTGTVSFYNDSAGTNPIAAAAAIRSFKEPLIVISGGKDKGFDYGPLTQAVTRSLYVRNLILIGENRPKIEQSLTDHSSRTPLTSAATLQGAVRTAWQLAGKLITGGTPAVTILFAPAAASFDMFKSYSDRGEQFDKIVATMTK